MSLAGILPSVSIMANLSFHRTLRDKTAQCGDTILVLWQKNAPKPKGEAGGKVLTESRHTLREEKRGMIHIIHSIR
jgi:hypothetical protein